MRAHEGRVRELQNGGIDTVYATYEYRSNTTSILWRARATSAEPCQMRHNNSCPHMQHTRYFSVIIAKKLFDILRIAQHHKSRKILISCWLRQLTLLVYYIGYPISETQKSCICLVTPKQG